MNLLQTFYSNRSKEELFKASQGFNSPEIHWLSFAYSCLQLRKYHEEYPLILNANASVLDLLLDKFNLPYTDSSEIKLVSDYNKYFYAWPKIEVYAKQKEPFIHIDNDIFIWESLPQELFKADLVAQHEERDSTFYMRVLKHMRENGIKLPELVEKYLTPTHLLSYNAGLFGGQNLLFFEHYIDEIHRFLELNKKQIKVMPETFLMNVVFEQWLFYAMVKNQDHDVTTYYKNVIIDFKIAKGEQLLAIDGRYSKYLHLMSYKRNQICNNVIVRNMYREYPDHYHRIISVCRNGGITTKVKYVSAFKMDTHKVEKKDYTRNYPRSIHFSNEKLQEYNTEDLLNVTFIDTIPQNDLVESFLKIHAIESEKNSLSKFIKQGQEKVIQFQDQQHTILAKLSENENNFENYQFKLSPYARAFSIAEDIEPFIFYDKKNVGVKELIFSYDYFFDQVDEYIYGNLDSIFINIFKNSTEFLEITSRFQKLKNISIKEKLITFIKVALFSNVLYATKIKER